jgi:Carboxypeptidase regulatory-like domain
MNIRFCGLLPVSLSLIIGATAARASITGTISGVVTDPSGSVVPRAEVTVTEVSTGVSQAVQTNDDGVYSFLSLPVGGYRLEVKAGGFQTYVRRDIILNTNDKLRFDVVLQVGQVTQQVEVSTSAVHVETVNTQLGDVIKSGSMEALPLNGRMFTDLLGLQPGVVPEFSAPGMLNTFATTEQGNVSIGGQRETSNGFLVNGSNVNNALNNGAAVVPNLDSIAEFRVLTGNFDAENGNYSGGLVSVVTKSGTNQFHGSAFEFLRNTNLDARNFYNYNNIDPATGQEEPGTARGVFQQNQFGGTIGGPIKRDAVFFFADYQGTRTNQGQSSGLIPVPSLAERAGDFAANAGALTGTVIGPYFAQVLSQELGYPVTAGEHYYAAGCTTSSQCVFPNAVIPQSAFSAPATALLKYIPLPNSGPYFESTANEIHTRDDLGAFRIDANTRRWGMLSGYYFIDDNSQFVPFGTNNTPGFPTANGGRSQLWTFGDTKSFGASALNELHLSWNRYVYHNNEPVGGYPISLSSLGFQEGVPGGITPATPEYESVPSIGFSTFSIGLTGVNYNRYIETPAVLDNFSKVIGRHSLKLGGQYVFNDFYEPMPLVGGNGFISFNGVETGIDFADYLVGAPASFVQEGGFNVDNRRNYFGTYAQDSWRARPNLTLNYGLRWELFQPWYEKRLQSSTFVYGVNSTVYPGAPTGYLFPGDNVPGFGKIPNTIARTQHDNFAPRLGFAYSPSASGGALGALLGGQGKFSIRGGFGMFYTNIEGSQQLDETGLAPFDVFTVLGAPLFAAPYTNRASGAIQPTPFPFTPPPPGSTNFNWATYLPLSGYPVPQIIARTPYTENYNLTVQRQFAQSTVLTLGFVGSQAHRLLAPVANNPGNAQLCLSLSQPSDVAPGTPTCGPFLEGTVFTRADGTMVNGTRGPFGPNFGDNYWFTTAANSNYNALQMSVRYNTSRLSFFASYTYSKSLDNASSLGDKVPYPYDPRLSKGLSTFDETNNFVVSYVYVLPFDRLGRPRLTSGWRLVGITRFATGFPIIMNETDDRSLVGTYGSGGSPFDTPDFLGGNLNFTNPRTAQPYFNTSLFQPEQLGYPGTANRAFFHGPGINNFDIGLQKDLKLTESKTMQFRAEFFNIFNHAQFLNPSGNINGAFGIVTNAASPRIGQFAIKFLF